MRQHEQRRFVQALSEKGCKLPSLAELQKGGTQVVEQLESVFISQDADHWQKLLVAVDLGCVRADTCLPSEFWCNGHSDGSVHPLQCAPHTGQHNQELLQEYGYSAAQIAALKDTHVIWQE